MPVKKMVLDDDGHCFVCGKMNDAGLRLEFKAQDGSASALFHAEKHHQGFKDIVHGGIISAILDEAMVKAVLSRGVSAMTAEITVRMKAPLRAGDTAIIAAKIIKEGNRLIETSARMIREMDNVTVAEARAKLLRNV